MPDLFVVVISGAGRGLGNELAQAYLAQPNSFVVGTIRDDKAPGVANLRAAPKGKGTELLLLKLESSSPADAMKAVEEMKTRGISHVDLVIANAGLSPPLASLESVDLEEVKGTFSVNAIGPLALYQACFALLQKSSNAKFVTISNSAGSIGEMTSNGAFVAPAYCISKAALNWITLAAHCGNTWLTAIAINPGLVATDMGNITAKYLGLERAPITKAQSAEKIIRLVDAATRDNLSGKFISAMNRREILW
ncbi:hypothetical protein QQS21_007460 [Conoideocrella luteorostrata]|uniref:NAD(P)-binding protein n=1 Tax=Conoideocrella luteorostrata TaxID=1105319 RepID=A0AAJ0CNJ1_9HYPO|nr:hypothetical protein QQS21_007460 [Conoideocrella luteorostrata]